MANVRSMLDAAQARGPRPTALRVERTLGQQPDFRARKKVHELAEVQEKVSELRAAGIKPTVVVEMD